ncbi:MAG: xanthine dehydrogenase family protein subunit M [Desulfurococcaceae archaeon]
MPFIPLVNITERNTRIIPVDFEYFEPKTIEEALELLNVYSNEAKILAGGTDLLVKIKVKLLRPKVIINIKRISELRYIVEDNGYVKIGALTTLRDLERSEIVKQKVPALFTAVNNMGSIQVRNMATIGGNLCNASPAADTAPPLLVHEAVVKVRSVNGERLILLEDFFRGPGIISMRPNEMLVEVMIKKSHLGASAFRKISRVAVDLAVASAAVYLEVSEDTITETRVSLGSVAPTPLRARKTELKLKGLKVGSNDLREALTMLEQEVSPITDMRSTAEYRRYIIKTLVWDALNDAYTRLKEGSVEK